MSIRTRTRTKTESEKKIKAPDDVDNFLLRSRVKYDSREIKPESK